MPEEWREYRACRLFDLSPSEYAAMPWTTTEMWFRFLDIEHAEAERRTPPERRKR